MMEEEKGETEIEISAQEVENKLKLGKKRGQVGLVSGGRIAKR